MDKQKMCDKCEEHEGTHRLFYEMLCDECYPRAKALSDAERRASGRQIDYAELALGIEERDAELARLRAALAEAERERDEALSKLADAESERDECKATRDTFCNNWRKSSAAFDEAHKSALKWMDKAIETRMTLDNVWEREKRQRRTIRALVLVARVTRLAAVGFAVMGDWGAASRRVHDEIRYGIEQAKQAERGQAGKE